MCDLNAFQYNGRSAIGASALVRSVQSTTSGRNWRTIVFCLCADVLEGSRSRRRSIRTTSSSGFSAGQLQRGGPGQHGCRGWYVTQGVNAEANASVFAATSPLDAKRVLCYWARERVRDGKPLKSVRSQRQGGAGARRAPLPAGEAVSSRTSCGLGSGDWYSASG